MRIALFATAALAGCGLSSAPTQTSRTQVAGDSPLAEIFARVSADTGVPADVLAAVSWNETRFHFATPAPDSHAFETGLMALTEAGPRDLHRGALLAGVREDAVRSDAEASIRAGAALLREHMIDGDVTTALRAYGGDSFTHAIQSALARGIDGRDDAGRGIVVAARTDVRSPGVSSVAQASGYAGAEWQPAYSGNYQTASRGVGDIKSIIIHDTEGSYSGTISWFKDPAAEVSAHYVVRSSDGHIAQIVDEKNIAWHVACYNTNTVGIEHEGYASKPDQWFTEAMYAESAKLTAYLADKYMIRKEHGTGAIQGHGEAPDCSDHTDPGPGWKWDHYIDLVRTGGASQFKGEDLIVDAPDVITSGELATVTVTVLNTGTAAWDLDATRIGTQDPQDRASDFFVDGDWISTNRATAVDAKTDAGVTGTFTFQIRGPAVTEPTVYDEAFSFVQEGVTWFGPTFHVVTQVRPSGDEQPGEDGGCNAAGSGGIACAMLALGVLPLRRRRRRR
ncbi:MAG TPA: N-acetylmuramoyl-L-alanine amidase [Kofleriaceae bacterium]